MCKCIEETNKALGEKANAELAIPFTWDPKTGQPYPPRVNIETRNIETSRSRFRRTPPKLLPSFCPFCGLPYDARPLRVRARHAWAVLTGKGA